ncbi:MAG: type I-E CRISPR-associated protein Cas7/Cse4/CasC [Dehalococcoidia bacterium]|nr:type I-E CRISPR-associated protein Cas7/Cse4/CasC [Dehalococcoidia bacterium]
MIVELHLIQNFAPANLNRDDTGAPKTCEFGGVRRARISSQALKRAIRQLWRAESLLPPEHLGYRTLLLVQELANRLAARGRSADEAQAVARRLIETAGIDLKASGMPGYLVFIGERELAQLADLGETHWAVLQRGSSLPSEVKKAIGSALDGGKAVDIAMFGRMLADIPTKNVEAAVQVAHAISTHAVAQEFDYFTAVDDLKRTLAAEGDDVTGAGMIGTVEFNSSCFYRYLNVDVEQLLAPGNLNGERDLARTALRALLDAGVRAIPSGKQNSMAAHNPPSLVMTVVRDWGCWSLANAFAKPVRPGRDGDLITASVEALDVYWGNLTRMYGGDGIRSVRVATERAAALATLRERHVEPVAELIRQTVEDALP